MCIKLICSSGQLVHHYRQRPGVSGLLTEQFHFTDSIKCAVTSILYDMHNMHSPVRVAVDRPFSRHANLHGYLSAWDRGRSVWRLSADQRKNTVISPSSAYKTPKINGDTIPILMRDYSPRPTETTSSRSFDRNLARSPSNQGGV